MRRPFARRAETGEARRMGTSTDSAEASPSEESAVAGADPGPRATSLTENALWAHERQGGDVERDSPPTAVGGADSDTGLLADVGVLVGQTASVPGGSHRIVPVRVCRKCSTQSQTSGDYCPHCGARFSRRRMGTRAKIFIAVAVVVLVGGGASAAIVVKIHHDNQVKAQQRHRALKARQAARAAQAAQRLQQSIQNTQTRLKVAERRVLVGSLQASITKDAQKDVDNGILSGPNMLRAVCTPVGGGNIQDTLADHTGDWSCLAVNQDNPDGTSSGYRFSGTINYDTGTYTWHLGGP